MNKNKNKTISIQIPDYIRAELSEGKEGFLFNSHNGGVYLLNMTAAYVFQQIKEGFGFEEILKKMAAVFDVRKEMARADLQDFIFHLKEMGCV